MSDPWLDLDATTAAQVTASKRAVFHVSVCQVADKYACPGVKQWAGIYMRTHLIKALDWARGHAQDPHVVRVTGLWDIVRAVYDATAHRAAGKELLWMMLFNNLLLHPVTSPYGVPNALRAEVLRIALVVPQFGADMFVVTARCGIHVSKLQVVDEVVCAAVSCQKQMWAGRDDATGRCVECGLR